MARNGGLASNSRWQAVSILLCATLAVLMILNTQMSGEGMWFWYGTAFRNGAKLYSQLHTALQPLFFLETGTWLLLFGSKLLVYEIPSLIHALLLAFAIYLVLRESTWPDWQKAFILVGAFIFTVGGHSYRLDDYHVVAEFLIMFSLWVLLLLGRPSELDDARRDLRRVVLLGVLSGFTWTTRVTDGAALVTAVILTLPFLLRRRRVAGLVVFGTSALLTVVITVLLTGDSLSAYLANSIFRAAASKGGTGSIFAAPIAVIGNTLRMLPQEKGISLFLLSLFVLGFLVHRYWPKLTRFLVPLQLAFSLMLFILNTRANRGNVQHGAIYEGLVLYLTLAMYAVAALVAFRLIRCIQKGEAWDRREILILVPILEWASYSAGAAAEPLTNYYEPVALLCLLVPVLQPARRQAAWLYPTVTTILGLVAITGIVSKVEIPYSWQNYKYAPMFEHREWIHHPVYGPMYVDSDLLHFSQQLCNEIGANPGVNHPDVLSLPYPYPNYFCATAPWHGYVQTFFDTATRGAMDQLMGELNTAPPQWIVYQRQINIMGGSERLYNHGDAIPQRYLDAMIAGKLADGEWRLVDFSNYLQPDHAQDWNGTGWYLIRTTR